MFAPSSHLTKHAAPVRSLLRRVSPWRDFHSGSKHTPLLQEKRSEDKNVQKKGEEEKREDQLSDDSPSVWGFPSASMSLSGLENELFNDPFFRPFRGFFPSMDTPLMRRAMEPPALSRNMRPVVMDLKEYPDRYELVAEVPGMPKEKIKLDFDSKRNVLSLSGEMQYEHEQRSPEGAKDEDAKFLSVERRFGNFFRTVRLPDRVNAEQIKAHMEHGVLTVRIPKREPEKREKERIKINVD